MTPKQKKFCDHYIKTGNGAESARVAGYKGKNHNNIASENLAKLYIKEYINKELEKKDKEIIADQNEILKLITEAARGNMEEDCIVVLSTGDYCTKAINKNKKIVPRDRLKALEMLAKINGLFDNDNLKGMDPVVIKDDVK